MTTVDVSIILPVGDESRDILARVVKAYAERLDASAHSWEILLVPSTRAQMSESQEAELTRTPKVRVCPPTKGWGAAVTAGLRASSGELLCYTNWQRTSASALSQMLSLALRNPDVVLRTNRRTRDTRVDRMGSLLYNLECRLLLQVPAWDINGTPKIFPRAFTDLLDLKQPGDLLDAEFALMCERAGYPVIEVPIEASLHCGLSGAFDFWPALRLYMGVIKLRLQMSK
jgi:hypothetical protein